MQAIRRADTKPEVALRSALHRLGYRFRKDHRIKTSIRWVRPDIVFTKQRVAVFVDGCFWHGCPEHGHIPTRNVSYWLPKLNRNRARDAEVDELLGEAGWCVTRIWEHELTIDAVDLVARTLAAAQMRIDAGSRTSHKPRCG
jgi:DNA mismatch endonuclease (patch repair protein)